MSYMYHIFCFVLLFAGAESYGFQLGDDLGSAEALQSPGGNLTEVVSKAEVSTPDLLKSAKSSDEVKESEADTVVPSREQTPEQIVADIQVEAEEPKEEETSSSEADSPEQVMKVLEKLDNQKPTDVAHEEQPVQAQETDEQQEPSTQEDEEGPAPEEIPAPPTPAQAPEQEDVELVESQGIDTVDINEPEGNWLFKRIWWEKSKDLFGKIRDYVDRIVESRMHFFQERVTLERNYIDPFYISIGMNKGALTEGVEHLLDVLQKEREQEGSLQARELELYQTLLEEQQTLTQLKDAIDDIQKLDDSLDQTLTVLLQQINLARSYEREAWQLLNRIAEELSDKKAREDYYAIATLWRNVKEVGNYITGPFAQHFVQLAGSTVEQIELVQEKVAALKERGVELTHEVESHDGACEVPAEESHVAPEPQGWFAWIWQSIKNWFTW